MTVILRNPTLTLLVAGLAGLAGCSAAGSTAPRQDPAGPDPRVRLTATLVSPIDITLTWRGHDPDAAGRIVEFATEPRGRYTILQFVPAWQTTYAHRDLMPETPFYYRVRPVYGPASPPVDVTLPKGDFDENARADDDWAAPRTVPGAPATQSPIRGAGAGRSGAPTELHATVMHANGIRFTWTDHASDEEGYLLEVRPAGSQDFGVAAVLDPDVNSFGLVTLPNEKRASFRIRAFYYGKPSNVAHRTTGPEPSTR
jgi:hypothetical protein